MMHAISPPNVVLREHVRRGFYVSYNFGDRTYYGSDTTALVSDSMDRFYILDGDHRKQYDALLDQGWDACFAYFIANIAQRNKNNFYEPLMLDLNVPMPPRFSFSVVTPLNSYNIRP